MGLACFRSAQLAKRKTCTIGIYLGFEVVGVNLTRWDRSCVCGSEATENDTPSKCRMSIFGDERSVALPSDLLPDRIGIPEDRLNVNGGAIAIGTHTA